jgi:hypothetical protein
MNILNSIRGTASGGMPLAAAADPKELLLLRDLLKDLPSSSQPRKVRDCKLHIPTCTSLLPASSLASPWFHPSLRLYTVQDARWKRASTDAD